MYKQAAVRIEVRKTLFSTDIPEVSKVVSDTAKALGRQFEKEEFLKLVKQFDYVIDKVKSSYEDLIKAGSYKRLGDHTIVLVIVARDDLEHFRINYFMYSSEGLAVELSAYETPNFSSEMTKYKEDTLEKYGFLKEPEKSEDRLVHVFCNGIKKDIPFNVYKQMKKELDGIADCSYTEI